MDTSLLERTVFWLLQGLFDSIEKYEGKRMPKEEKENLKILNSYLKIYHVHADKAIGKLLKG